jgi:hypothetical protein
MTFAPGPKRRSLSDIKSNLMRPATTSHFDVHIREPAGTSGYTWNNFKTDNGLIGFDQNFLHLCCSETVLPGSSLATTEINNDFTGVTERHAYRRLFDDRIDLTFYVMQDQSLPTPNSIMGAKSYIEKFFPKPSPNSYLPIRFFEAWIKYIAMESQTGDNSVAQSNMSYRMRFPNEYYGGIAITKYERDYNNNVLRYNFVNAYPISVSSMPVTYDSSDLLKCTVSFSYVRYFIDTVSGSKTDPMLGQLFGSLDPLSAADIQNSFLNPPKFDTGVKYGDFNFDTPTGAFDTSLNLQISKAFQQPSK